MAMRDVLMCSFLLTLAACSSNPAWVVTHSDRYRVTEYSTGAPGCAVTALQQPGAYFEVRRVIASADSSMPKDFVQHQLYWCQSADTCDQDGRDFSLQTFGITGSPELQRSTAQTGADCTIIRHAVTGKNIVVTSDTYSSEQRFSPDECEALQSSPPPAKFRCVAHLTLRGESAR
jgi:hypothetical protein